MIEYENEVLVRADLPAGSVLQVDPGTRRIAPGACRNGVFAEVVLPDGLTEIGESAFERVKTATMILPRSLRRLGRRAFYESVISEVSIAPRSVECIPEGCFERSSLNDAALPDGVTKIGDNAFRGAFFLRNLSLPETLVSVGDEAFRDCKRLNIFLTLPESCRSVGARAFFGAGLESLNLQGKECVVGDDAFAYCCRLKSLCVPDLPDGKDLAERCFRGVVAVDQMSVPDRKQYVTLVQRTMEASMKRNRYGSFCDFSAKDPFRIFLSQKNKECHKPQLSLSWTDTPDGEKMTAADFGLRAESAYKMYDRQELLFADAPNSLRAFLDFAKPDFQLIESIYRRVTAEDVKNDLEDTIALIEYKKKMFHTVARPLFFE